MPKRDLEDTEVQDWATVNIEHAEDCVESTISQVIVAESKLSQFDSDWTVQETEKLPDEDEVTKSKYEAVSGLRSRVAVCNTLIK